jgi:exonuclease SbcC
MKIKKISLNNIRSYEDQDIVFPDGSILLSGDIGSGKTSVLLGIEFALFGLQPGQKSSSLLRNGKNSGRVVFHFEANGKDVIIERNLKRGKAISQDNCYITIDGSKTQLSVMELKSLVLDLLNYPREFSKKQNLLYKFTVYTPQEEMKQIIQEDSESRINTLRHIFGIDKYKTILENSSLLAMRIREEKRIKEAMISGIGKETLGLSSMELELQQKNSQLSSMNEEFSARKKETAIIRQEKENITEKVEEGRRIRQEMEKNRITMSMKQDIVSGNEGRIARLKGQIGETGKGGFSEADFASVKGKIESRQMEREAINGSLIEISSRIILAQNKNAENELLREKISHLDTCPTCLQQVNESHKESIMGKCDHALADNGKELSRMIPEKSELLGKAKRISEEISSLEREAREMELLRIRLEENVAKAAEIREMEKSSESLAIEIASIGEKTRSLSEKYALLKGYDGLFSDIERKLDAALNGEKSVEIRMAECKREAEFLASQISDVKLRIAESEKARKEANYLTEIENWLFSDFTELVSMIEKNIMAKLRSEFSKVFSNWFSMLVSESFNAYITDDFTPVIEQQDYELDYDYLSGGERTAVALAYRLALNQLINSVLSRIETKNIVILDEPTDGFSSQQLDKMRDVLSQLNVSQLIIVSHEPKIESFVDSVIKFRKDNGISAIG